MQNASNWSRFRRALSRPDTRSTIGKLRELKDLGGVQLALDDFGTGYCSLVYLEHRKL